MRWHAVLTTQILAWHKNLQASGLWMMVRDQAEGHNASAAEWRPEYDATFGQPAFTVQSHGATGFHVLPKSNTMSMMGCHVYH